MRGGVTSTGSTRGTKRRIIGAICVAAVALTAVTAADAARTSPQAKTFNPDLQGQTLTVWTPAAISPAQKSIFTDFEAATGATLDVQAVPDRFETNLLAKWATGARPDILFFHGIRQWLSQLDPQKTLKPLTGEAFINNAIPNIIPNSTAYKGVTYGAPLDFPNMDGVFYNRQVFKRLKLTIPKNFNQLLALCKTIKQKDPSITPIFAGGGDQWPLLPMMFMMWNDAIKSTPLISGLNSGKVAWMDPRIIQGITKEQQLKQAGCYNSNILTATFADEQKALDTGKSAMTIQVSVIADAMVGAYGAANVNKTVGYFPVSANSTLASWQLLGTGGIYVPKTGNSDKEAAAVDFVRFATGAGYGKYLQTVKQFPIYKGYPVPGDVPKVYVEMHKAYAHSVPEYEQTLDANVGTPEAYLQGMIAGKKTPAQVGAAINRDFRRNAKVLGVPGF